MESGNREEIDFNFEFQPLLTTLDDPNDAIPVAFDFVGMVKDEDKRGGVFDVDEYQDSKRAKLGDDDANDGNGEVKRSKRSRKETLKQKEEKRDFGECDRCRKHGQECDKQRVCAYCEIGGVVCERLPDKKPPKIIQTSVKKKIEIPTMDVLAPAPGEEAPRCENCRRGHRKCDRKVPCRECTTRGLDCMGNSAKRDDPMPARVSEAEWLMQLPCQECRNLHRKCDRNIPCTSCVARGVACSLQDEKKSNN